MLDRINLLRIPVVNREYLSLHSGGSHLFIIFSRLVTLSPLVDEMFMLVISRLELRYHLWSNCVTLIFSRI